MNELERIARETKITPKPIQDLIYILNSQGESERDNPPIRRTPRHLTHSAKGYIINKGNRIYQLTTL